DPTRERLHIALAFAPQTSMLRWEFAIADPMLRARSIEVEGIAPLYVPRTAACIAQGDADVPLAYGASFCATEATTGQAVEGIARLTSALRLTRNHESALWSGQVLVTVQAEDAQGG